MRKNTKWASLLSGLAMLGGVISPAMAEESFNLWQECATRCNLDLGQGVRSSQLDLSTLLDEQAEQGVLHYSMVLGEGSNSLKLAIDNALTLRSDGSSITLTSATAGKEPRSYSYHRQGKGSWSLHWLVPSGMKRPPASRSSSMNWMQAPTSAIYPPFTASKSVTLCCTTW